MTTINQNPLAALVAAMKPTPEQLAAAARALTDQQLAALVSGACSCSPPPTPPPVAPPATPPAPRPHATPPARPKASAAKKAPAPAPKPPPAKAKAPPKDTRSAYDVVYEELVGHTSVSIPEVVRWTGLERHRIEHALRRMVAEGKAFRSGGRGLGGAHFAVTQESADAAAEKAAAAAQAAQAS